MLGLRVFLSSTATDLVEHRRMADDTLLRLQQQSVVMERFGALPGSPVAECERLAASADLVVCIVAHRYGYEPAAGGGSITRREVEAARRAGKPVYAWIVDDKHPWTETREQDLLTQRHVLADPGKQQDVLGSLKGLQEFKDWLRKNVVCDSFTTADDLGRRIATTLANVSTPPALSDRASKPASPESELRVVHALQPAPHFNGRDALVETLSAWVDDTASPDRIHALVAAGGTGKTAIVERVVALLQQRWPPPGAGSVLVWSFYERPDADAFVRECAQLFLGETDDTPAGGRLERLQRGLRDGRPHLIVLDGLERVQAEADPGQVRGELEDHTLKLLLQAIASGLGRTRALVTSRFPLTDLRDWQRRGVVETLLEDLGPDAARRVLRGWGVKGDDAQLDAVSAQVGLHALSVAVIGSYLGHFEAGRIEAAAALDLDVAVGDDRRAAKLARVLAFYAERLPAEERELLARLSVFPRGITLEVLWTLVDAGGQVAGALVNAKPALTRLLVRLLDRGLVFRYATTDGTITWTAHPFVRQRFASLLECSAEAVFDAVASALGRGLEQRPDKKPDDTVMLDRYERLIEATRLAGRPQEAFEIYWDGLGGSRHLAIKLGDYYRGYRILRGFLPSSGNLKEFGTGLTPLDRSLGLNDLALMASCLGRLPEAADLWREDNAISRELGDPLETAIRLNNTSGLAYYMGRLGDAVAASEEALAEAERSQDLEQRANSLVAYAMANHQLGNVSVARRCFDLAATLAPNEGLYPAGYQAQCRHVLDLGDISAAAAIAEAGLASSRTNAVNYESPGWHGLLARIALAEGRDPTKHVAEIRRWTVRTADMEAIIDSHHLAARAALTLGDLPAARAEADDGVRQARLCGFRLHLIELMVTQSAIELAWPNAGAAVATAREALDIATAPECGYAWGEADAAHAWGLAFEALGEREHAHRAFTQALAVRERIEHPQVDVTRSALVRLEIGS